MKPSNHHLLINLKLELKMNSLKVTLTTNLTFYQIVNSNLAQMAEFDANGNINTNNQCKNFKWRNN